MQSPIETLKAETLREALATAATAETFGEDVITAEMIRIAPALSAYSRLALDLWERYSGNPPARSIDAAAWARFRRAVLNERCFPTSTAGRLMERARFLLCRCGVNARDWPAL